MKKSLLSLVALTFIAAPVLTAYDASAQNRPESRRDLRDSRRDLRDSRREVRLDRRQARPAWLRNGGGYAGGGRAVSDYRRYGLRVPGAGRHWVRYDNSYMLVTIASGLIGSIIVSQ